ncbi:glycoside hydrolase family 64 protein [Krasilnikovia sp. M28-CT-15]|uniref:glycoside hydrolase family 64 protein n=1 Tax=Krasilnikovia sp. M28-CT-15 TaxID=3373540 RepID=UPI003876B2AF
MFEQPRQPRRRRLAAAAAALAVAASAAVTAVTTTGAEAAVAADTLPLTIANQSGRGEQVYVYNIGTLLSTGQQGWADASGTFHPWPGGGSPPVDAPDASITGPAAGASLTIRMPKFSGRVYFSYGRKLVFKLATGGLVQPAVQSPTDPNADTLFNWTEYTLNDDGLWINSTQVDMFSAPYQVGLTRPDGATVTTGKLKPGGYRAFFSALRAQPGGWAGLVRTRADGTVLRALAPGHGIEAGALPGNLLDDYVNRVWDRYRTETLTVAPFADQPGIEYHGKVTGDVLNFTNTAGQVVTTFGKPDSDSILGCYKLLDAPNDLVRGPISRTLCAGFNRGTLLSSADQPYNEAGEFYADDVTNEYARLVHAHMADGRAYAFAFDDVGAHESLVHDGNPQRAAITLDPLD